MSALFQPLFIEKEAWMRDVIAFSNDEQIIVAVIPMPIYALEEKERMLTDYAKSISVRTEKQTIVTQDLSVFMMMSRMRKRGFDPSEEARLRKKLASIKKYCYTA